MLRSVDCILRVAGLLKGLQKGQADNIIILGGPLDGRSNKAGSCEVSYDSVLWRVYVGCY